MNNAEEDNNMLKHVLQIKVCRYWEDIEKL